MDWQQVRAKLWVMVPGVTAGGMVGVAAGVTVGCGANVGGRLRRHVGSGVEIATIVVGAVAGVGEG